MPNAHHGYAIRRIHIDGGDSIYAQRTTMKGIEPYWLDIRDQLRVERETVRRSGVVRYVLDTPKQRAEYIQEV